MRGYRAERELVIMLWRMGFAVMRAPASGSKVKKVSYPDVVAIHNGKVLVFEVKTRKHLETIYVDEEQLRKLMEFSSRAGGRAYIAIKIPSKDWVFIDVNKLEKHGSRYKISTEVLSKGYKIYDVLKQNKIELGLAKFMNKD